MSDTVRDIRPPGRERYQILEALLDRKAKLETSFAPVREIERSWADLADYAGPEALPIMVAWVREHLERIGASGLVFGASGGVDSSLAAVVGSRAAPGRCRALLMPCRSASEDGEDAARLMELLGIPYQVRCLEPVAEGLLALMGSSLQLAPALVAGNLVARIRGALLYYEANLSGCLVLGTGDLDEAYVGYSCKGTTSDLFPIAGLHKSEVRTLLYHALEPLDQELARRLAGRAASPGYWPGQRAEDELGLDYDRIGGALDVLMRHCDLEATGPFPRAPEEFLEALARHGVSQADFLAVADRIVGNYHKGFGSPVLSRPRAGPTRPPEGESI